MSRRSLHWFRKGLRLHDNPALVEAAKSTEALFCVFVIDPHFAKESYTGPLRYEFLLQSLRDLDKQLTEKYNTRLFVARGKPETELVRLWKKWNIDHLTFESDIEPYARPRDAKICSLAGGDKIKVSSFPSHTIHDPERLLALAQGKCPTTFGQFQKLFTKAGKVAAALSCPAAFPPSTPSADYFEKSKVYSVPTLEEMGFSPLAQPLLYPGGETEALRRLDATIVQRSQWAATFEKPKTIPNSLEPSTTVLSPYLKFGCLSPRKFYHEVAAVYAKHKSHSQPPVSLHGQILWREFWYLNLAAIGGDGSAYGRMADNPLCRKIDWDDKPEFLAAWEHGRTGYPFIDAIMTQLRQEGWIHHLARHAVACFLTRGDLYVSWEKGAAVFDRLLLDADYALNNSNWMWLSCSSFFYQYFRCYSPVAFGKKTDKQGLYIRKYLPQLKHFPAKYIYEPWTAPIEVQRQSKCIIGEDYPKPIVDHKTVSKVNMGRMKAAYDRHKQNQGGGNVPSAKTKPKPKPRKKSHKGSDKQAKLNFSLPAANKEGNPKRRKI